MKFFKWLSELLKSKPQPKKPVVKKPQRRYLKDVKAGEVIQIEWYRIKGGIGNLKVLNNDPETKKICLKICGQRSFFSVPHRRR